MTEMTKVYIAGSVSTPAAGRLVVAPEPSK